MKFSAVRGTVSQKTSILMSPNVVSSVTDMAELLGQLQMEDGGLRAERDRKDFH